MLTSIARLRLFLFLVLGTILFAQCSLLEELMTEPGSVGTRAPRSAPSTSSEMKLRSNIADFAKQQIGSRYKYAGTSPRTGFDCSGFTSYVLAEHGIRVSHSSRAQATEGRSIPPTDAQPGDLVYFKRSGSTPVFHVALVVNNDRSGIEVVHSTSSRGVIRENISKSSYWQPKIAGARTVVR